MAEVGSGGGNVQFVFVVGLASGRFGAKAAFFEYDMR